MKHPIYTVFVIILISITFCTENPTNIDPEDQLEIVDNNLSALVKIENVLNIDIGGAETNFKFRVTSINSEDSLLLQNRKVMWDFNSDGIFDTDWIETDSTNKVFSELGKHNITAKILFDENKVGICSRTVYSQPVFDLMNGDASNTVHEMCYSYNEEKVFFSWGDYPHQIYSMDKYGNNIECISCNFQNEKSRHFPVASPNGKYLSYFHNGNTPLLSLETNEETIIENVYSSTNSFTNDSKCFLYLTANDNKLHSINLETKKDSIIINNIRHFSVIPNENKIAFLKYDVVDPEWPPK